MARKQRSIPPPVREAANDVDSVRPAPLTEQQEQYVQMGLPWVEHNAVTVTRWWRDRFEPHEMMGPGTIGLLEAARRYEPERHPSFPHYAQQYIRGRMLNAIRSELFTLRGRVEHAMERGFCGYSTHRRVDADLFADTEEALEAAAEQACADTLAASFVAAMAEGGDRDPEDDVLLSLDLRKALKTLYPAELQVVLLVHEGGFSVNEAAIKLGVHVNTAQNRYKKALRKLDAFLFGESDRG